MLRKRRSETAINRVAASSKSARFSFARPECTSERIQPVLLVLTTRWRNRYRIAVHPGQRGSRWGQEKRLKVKAGSLSLNVVDTSTGERALLSLHYWRGSARTWSVVTSDLASYFPLHRVWPARFG